MRALLRGPLDLLSSVRFGILLMVLLFLYMSIGSAGLIYPIHPNILHPDAWHYEQLRQRPWFELTEYEWFHWWPFDLLVLLFTLTLVVTTLRRIRLTTINLGVWMIHCGVLILVAGSVWYFSTKVEGEAPVIRRAVTISVLPSGTAGAGAAAGAPVAEGRLPAMPGNRTIVGQGADRYELEVLSTDPAWELRSGEHAGLRAWSTSISVTAPDGSRFIRQLIAGHPEYTEDMVFTDDRSQPVKRSVKVNGEPLVDRRLLLGLDYQSADWFYLRNDIVKSWALYLRKPGEQTWWMRPIHGLPLYNDRITRLDDVFMDDPEAPPAVSPLRVTIPPAGEGDPFPSLTLAADGYLRYAEMDTREAAGGPGAPVNPVARFAVRSRNGRSSSYVLAALDPAARSADEGAVSFRLVKDEAEFARLARPPMLRIRVPDAGIDEEAPIVEQASTNPAAAFRAAGPESAGVAWRVVAIQDRIPVAGTEVSVAIVEIKSPRGLSRRWVFDNPAMTRDAPKDGQAAGHADATISDPGVQVEYLPGFGRALVTLVAGPEPERLRVVAGLEEGPPRVMELPQGGSVDLGAGLSLALGRYLPRAVFEQKPRVVPEPRRIRDAKEMFSMIRVEAPGGDARWLRFHPYVFDRPEDVLRRYDYRPSRLRLADGSVVEVMFSRQRLPLPAQISLEEFILDTHVGGFTGETGSIRNYTSMVRFREPRSNDWSRPVAVSVNQPVEHGGYWYFQSQWDPPSEPSRQGERGSSGLNYTVLGVGNRKGVELQLAGVIIATLGMIYAFYVKPVLKRRRRQRVEALASGGRRAAPVAAGAAMAVALLAPSTPAAPTAPAGGPGDFASQVDLRPLGSVAVHTDGRLKSFASFAAGQMQFVSGPKRIAGQTPEFTYLDMLLRPELYLDADVIYVKNREVRARIADAWRQAAADDASRGTAEPGFDPATVDRVMKGFEASGLLSERYLWDAAASQWRRQILAPMRIMEQDLVRTAKQINAIRGALVVKQSSRLLEDLRVLPPGGGVADKPWRTIGAIQLLPGTNAAELEPLKARGVELDAPLPGLDPGLQSQVADAWRALINGWRAGDANAVNPAVQRLASLLPQTDPAVYPDLKRLEWESWYFRSGNMTWVWLVYMAALILLLLGLVYRWEPARRMGLGVFLAAFVLQTAAVGLRWWIADRWPNSNMFEAVTTSSWFGAAAAVILELLGRRTAMRGLFAMGASASSMVALMAAALLPVQLNPAIGNMMPVLHDVWLYIHTNVIIFSYCLIFMAAVTSLAYLGYRLLGGEATFARVGGAGEMLALSGGAAGAEPVRGKLGEVLDGVTMLLMELSFVLLWAGIAMGAIWADESWGRPWGWDPKEVFALNTFLVFAVLVHVRLKVRDKGLWTAWLAVVGAAVMLFNWIVINFVITGLHSYA